jgi:hypothetical protein
MAQQRDTKALILRLSGIDRRILYVIILVCVIVPLLAGVRLEMSVTPPVRGLYDAIEDLEAGSYVWLAADYDPGSMPELYPMNVAFVEHLFSKDLKYGIDYVNLGFKEGREAVMVSVAEDMRSTFPRDFAGTPWESIPMLEGIDDLSDVDMIVCVSAGYPGIKEWVQQIATRYNLAMGGGVTAVSGPEMYPYIQSGQLIGLLAGMKGAAEYEQLVGRPGLGLSGMVAQSYVHVMVVIFIIFANVVFIIEKRMKA